MYPRLRPTFIHYVFVCSVGLGIGSSGCIDHHYDPYPCSSQSSSERLATPPPYCPGEEVLPDCSAGPQDDGNPCTQDVCIDGITTHEPVSAGTPCDDGNACTVGDMCQSGTCYGGAPKVCNDGEVCGSGQCLSICPPAFGHTISTGSVAGALAVADFNGDAALDLVVAANDELDIFFNKGYGTFTAGSPHSADSQILAIVAADLNGDAMPDIALTKHTGAMIGGASLGILFNQGDGTFAEQSEFALGSSSGNLLANDLNGDGNLDIVVTVDGKASIFFNQGGGAFGAPISYYANPDLRFVVAGDFDGNGASDLALAAHTNGMTVMFNDGSGGFGAAVPYEGLDGSTSSLAVADWNGDGSTDVVVGHYQAASMLLNNGDGKFTVVAKTELVSLPPTMVVVDINADGSPDLATVNPSAGTMSLLSNKGDGSFASRSDHLAGALPSSIVAADFDADGKPDLAVTSFPEGIVSIYLNGCFAGLP